MVQYDIFSFESELRAKINVLEETGWFRNREMNIRGELDVGTIFTFKNKAKASFEEETHFFTLKLVILLMNAVNIQLFSIK